jgi:class 3 adenylate cyclase/pimeloyl-ACP methyl ester carboxylesterase
VSECGHGVVGAAAEGWRDNPLMARTQAVTILFCDLVQSTERRARLGDDAFDDFTKRFLGALRAAIVEAEGREVSSAGDGLMVVFPESVADALSCAATMHRSVAGLDPNDTPRLRIGISCGEVAQDGNDFSGMPIVEASRLEAAAAPGKTLASAVIRSLVGTRRAFRFRDVGALTLKGLPAPLATVEVLDDEVTDLPSPAASRLPAPRDRKRKRRALGVGIVALVVVLVGVAVLRGGSGGTNAGVQGLTKPVGYTPRFEQVSCPSDVRAVASDATCGHLLVPQDRAKPRGKQLSLLVTRAPSRVAGHSGEPSIDLCGCENVGNSLTRDHGELIQLSARGFQGSDPMLVCPEMSSERMAALAQRSNDPTEVARASAALAQCHDRLVHEGIDPAQYNYRVAAVDVLDLMVTLGIHRADFTASDLVSAEVFEVLRRAPGVVRSITIDNPAPPGQTELSDPVGDLAGAFDRYVARCNQNTTCASSYPDLAGAWRSAYARNETEPALVAAANPDDSSAPDVPVLLDGPRSADALGAALGDANSYSLIPAAITSPTADAVTADAVARSDYYSFHPAAPWGTLASYLCAYDVHTEDPNALALEATTNPQFTRAWTAHWPQWCAAWKVPDVSAALSTDVVSPVPALLFRGDLNAFGNAQWMRRIERGLSHAQTVTFPTLGGGLLANGPPCLSHLRTEFLAHPTMKLNTAACAKQSPPINFVAPS